jgi:cell wall-associated NlpC family hydrolase
MRRAGSAPAVLAALICAACGSQIKQNATPAAATVAPALHAHPHAVEPVAGAGAQVRSAPSAPTAVSVGPPGGTLARPAVQAIIAAGNEIAHLPYRYGGGHATYEDTAYDCSGSISFVFAAAGLLKSTVVSGQLMTWGPAHLAPGPGKWVTVFANAGHTFMYVAGLRFDTVALAETGSRWSNRPADEPDLRTFSVRHPIGL